MTTKYILEVMLDNDFPEDLKSHYLEYKCNGQDSGIDLIIPNEIDTPEFKVTTINHKISCQLSLYKDNKFIKYVSYWMLPRSSISKTPYRLANSVGLIDSGYRGNIIAKVDTIPEYNSDGKYCLNTIKPYIKKNTRLFQIAVGDLTPISEVKVVDVLSNTTRGSGGFGSTGK